MYDAMKAAPRYLIDYKTFTSAVDSIYASAESLNSTHANDVFLASLDEFRASLMKRKEARALVKQYQADCAAQQAALLGGATLESNPLFEGVSEDMFLSDSGPAVRNHVSVESEFDGQGVEGLSRDDFRPQLCHEPFVAVGEFDEEVIGGDSLDDGIAEVFESFVVDGPSVLQNQRS